MIVNFHSTHNAGDLALLKMNMRQLEHGFGNPSFTVTANYPDEPRLKQIENAEIIPSAFAIAGANRGAPLYRQILRLMVGIIHLLLGRFFEKGYQKWMPGSPWKQLITAFRQADLVAGVSGNYLLSMGKYGWPFPLTVFAVFAAILYHKPFFAMPQSIGPFRRGWEKNIVRWLFRRARRVFLRDQVSVDLAKELGLPQDKFAFIPDPAFGLPVASREEAEQILSRYGYQPGQQAVGITVIAPLSRALSVQVIDTYYQGLAAVIYRFARENGVRVYIFNQVTGPMEREDDRTAGRALLRLMPQDQTEVVLVDAVLEPEQLKACYSLMDLMIASRLHSAIFAMGAGVATVSVGYFTKTRGLLQAMGLENWLVELGQADADTLWRKITEAWAQRNELAAEIQTKAGAYADMTLSLGEQIREDYQQRQKGLRIVQLIKGLDIGGYNGGSDVFGINLACALKDAGIKASVVVFFQTNTPAEQLYLDVLNRHDVPVTFLQLWRGQTSIASYWKGFRILAEKLKRENISILHSHFHIGTLMAAWFRLFRIVPRTARTIHVDREWLRGWEGVLQQFIIRTLIFFLFPLLIDLEVGVSGESTRILDARWFAKLRGKKAHLIYNSVPSPDYKLMEEAAEAAGSSKNERYFNIVTIGRMTSQKGHEFLLAAIPQIVRELPHARFTWIGDGPLRAELEEKVVRLGVDRYITFTGLRHDVPAMLQEMDLFVLPSVYEGLPTVVLESMASAVPVIGTDIPGTREIIRDGENGWLVPPGDPQRLAAAIIRAAHSPAERVRVVKAALNSLAEFSIENAAEKYTELYRRLFL